MATALGMALLPAPPEVRVMGPAEAAVLRMKNEFRYQILLKATRRAALRQAIADVRGFAEKEKWPAAALMMDVDPMHVM